MGNSHVESIDVSEIEEEEKPRKLSSNSSSNLQFEDDGIEIDFADWGALD